MQMKRANNSGPIDGTSSAVMKPEMSNNLRVDFALFSLRDSGSLKYANANATAESAAAAKPGPGPGSPSPVGRARYPNSGPNVKPTPNAAPMSAMPFVRPSSDVVSAI